MPEFIALVVVIIATIYVFIKVKNGLQNKGKSKLSSISLAFVSSFFAFIVLMVLASSFFEDSKKQTQVKEPKQEIKTTQKEVKSNERIEATIATKITLDIVNSLKDNYNIEAGSFEDMPLYLDKLCSSDTACQIYAGKTQIQVVYKTVEALTSSRVTPQYYQNVCSAIFIGLSNSNKDLAEDIITQAFDYASKNGSAKSETLGVELKVEPDNMTGLLECRFYKY